MFKTLRKFGINLYSEQEVKSFENYFREKNQSLIDKAFGCSTKDETKTEFSFKSLKQTSLADNVIFAHNYQVLKTKTLDRNTYIKSKYPNLNKNIESQLEEIGVNKYFFETCFDELYKGTAGLIYFDENKKIKLIPFVKGETELVKVTRSRLTDDIILIEVLQDNNQWLKLDLSEPYYILYNTRQGNTYLSNLTLASPYIELQNKLTLKEARFIDSDFTGKPIISPNLDKLTSNGVSGNIDVTVGGETYEYLDFIQNSYPAILKQIREQIQNEKYPILPFGVDVTNMTQSNSQNQTKDLRTWLDEQITIACFSSGSITGKFGSTNRAVSEQDRDNLEENSVLVFQQKLADLVNKFVLPLLLPKSFEKFRFEFYREDTDESFKRKNLELRSFELLIRKDTQEFLINNGLAPSKEQIIALFKATHNLEMVEKKQSGVIDNGNFNQIADENFNQVQPNETKAVDKERLDEVFAKYKANINMSYSELLAWSKTEDSKKASLDRSPITRNLELLSTPKDKWTEKHIAWANKTIGFNSRMSKMPQGKPITGSKYSKRDISLRNWAYNPNKN